MTDLPLLDLSFNKLEGEVPNLEGLDRLEVMYLTGNSLAGPIPQWIKSRDTRHLIDLSYNNFDESSVPSTCRETLNLFRSYGGRKSIELGKCLRSCSKEIVFRGNRSFQSLGRRMFDVYIQGERRLKDFNIVQEAKGVDRAVTRNFSAMVKNKTLEIRFQYCGKGTTAVPRRGTYGPLVYAISVVSGCGPPSKGNKKIFIATAAELRGLDLRTGFFTYRQFRATTNNFDVTNELGEGGFGSVYKGTLLDGTIIAVKQLSSKSNQGNREFVNKIGMIKGTQLLLVYEYMENNSLGRALYGPKEWQLELDWPTRQSICIGIAKGLAFLHEESTLKIVHRDIKASNVLLDKELNPKISDFGLARLGDEENTHINTKVAGTIGYMAPEYALWGYLTYKADVYSFGIVALEFVAGKSNMGYRPSENFFCLLDWGLFLQKKGSLMELVDPRIGSNFNREEAKKIIRIALLCTSPSPAVRLTMFEVLSMLRGCISIQEFNMDPSINETELTLQALREKFDDMYGNSSETRAPGGSTSIRENEPSSRFVPDIDSFT